MSSFLLSSTRKKGNVLSTARYAVVNGEKGRAQGIHENGKFGEIR